MNTGGRARLCEEFSRQLGTNAHTSEKNSSFFNDRLVVFSMVIFVFVVCRSVGSHRHHCHSHFVVKKQRAKKVLNVLPVKVVRVISKRLIGGSFGLRAILQCPWGGGGGPPGNCGWGWGGRHSRKFLVGGCRLVLQILTPFQTKKCYFPHLFPDQTCKIHTRFQTWSLGGNVVIIT